MFGLTLCMCSGTLSRMLKMRLQRYGRKNQPEFRVVVTDSHNSPKTGNHVDVLGSYQPRQGTFQINAERAKDWISKGVQVSDTVHNFLISQKIIEGKKINVLPRKSPIVSEEAKAAENAEKAAETVAEEPKMETPAPAAPTAETPAPTEETASAPAPEEPKAEALATEDTPAQEKKAE